MFTTKVSAFSCCDAIKVWNETEGIANCVHRLFLPRHTMIKIVHIISCNYSYPLVTVIPDDRSIF